VSAPELSLATAGSDVGAHSRRRARALLPRVAAYGATRGAAEGMYAVRGILLAAVLGPAAFGSWALLRLGMRYAALGRLGVTRGLEFELLHPAPERERHTPAGVALGFMLAVAGAASALALAASFVVPSPESRTLLRGFAAAGLGEAGYTWALVCVRVRKSLRHYAALETGSAALHLVAALALARVWGLAGACAGMTLASLAGVAAAVPWVELELRWDAAVLRRLLALGVPVALTGAVGTILLTADRWVVAGWGGATMLGYYSFGASVAVAATALAVVIRTVVFADVYGDTHAVGSAVAVRTHLERAVLPYARLLPPVLGASSLLVGPVVQLGMPRYLPAVPSARLFFLGGVAMGLVNLASLGAVAAGVQRRLPLYAAGAVALTVGLALPALRMGLGLEGAAAAALAGHAAFAAAVVRLDARAAGVARPGWAAAGALAPLLWCAAAVVLAGRLAPGHDARAVILGLAAYLLLLAPLVPGWRAEWGRVRR
jgi:O-antigen/teichoic acid export membrane protein